MTKLTLSEIEDLLIEAEDAQEDIDDTIEFLSTPMCQEFFDVIYTEIYREYSEYKDSDRKKLWVLRDTIDYLKDTK